MTDTEKHSNPSAQETPRRLYTRPDSWIDLHPAEHDQTEGLHEGPPRYVVLERRSVVSGEGCAGCGPGCLIAFTFGLVLIGLSILGVMWVGVQAVIGFLRLLRIR